MIRRSRIWTPGALPLVATGPRRAHAGHLLWPLQADAGGGDDPYSPLSKSMLFDGVNEYVQFGSVPAMAPEYSDPFTWNYWQKTTSTGALLCAMSKQGTSGLTKLGNCADLGGRPWFEMYSGGSMHVKALAPAPNTKDGAWHMITATNSGVGGSAGLELYIDAAQLTGTEVAKAGALSSSVAGAGNLVVADRATLGREWPGNLCHGSGHNIEMSAADVSELYGSGVPQDLSALSTSAAVQWWCPLGDGDSVAAGDINDISGGGNDGSAANMEAADFVADVPP